MSVSVGTLSVLVVLQAVGARGRIDELLTWAVAGQNNAPIAEQRLA